MKIPPPRVLAWLVFGALLAWILALRAPSFPAQLWNVDEAIHAAVATTLQDGGVLYRDAIDQRTPLSYQAFRFIFALAGGNNLAAVRAVVAVMIALTAFGLFLLGRRARSTAVGAVGAVIFAALSTNLLAPADAFAAHTEWFAIFFTTWGAWLTWRCREQPAVLRAAAAGACFALGFLSKQPALLELGAPLALFGLLLATRSWNAATAVRLAGGLLAGFAAVLALCAAYFAAQGALDDAVFYTWTYNLRYYGPEIPRLERAAKALMPLAVLWREYPLILLALLGSGAAAIVQLVQVRPSEAEQARRPWTLFVLAWAGLAFGGAASGGRGFEHYAIQCLPAFSLLAATGVVAFVDSALACWRQRAGRALDRAAAALSLVLAVLALASCLWHPLAAWRVTAPPPDPAQPAADFIRAHSTPDESIFVWGYNPDVHLYADRKPASRFVYCSFLTGLIPWTNLAPEKDTAYAIVPGAMDALLRELEAKRPAFIVDCTPGFHRHFHKYPLTKFPALERFVAEHYAVVEAERFVPQGFRVHLIRDAFRRQPLATARTLKEKLTPPPPPVGPDNADLRATNYEVRFTSEQPVVRRLEVLLDGTPVEAVSFPGSRGARVSVPVKFNGLAAGRHELATRLTAIDGSTATSTPFAVVVGNFAVPAEQQAGFGLPVLNRRLAPITVQAPYGPAVNEADGRRQFYVHAPSRLVYELDGTVRKLSGACGILPGAFSPENNFPTDGAGFRIELVTPDGKRTLLFERVLRPKQNDWERGHQPLSVEIPAHPAGTRLEFSTNAGPNDNGACDWTYWNDLLLETPRE